tara:strand:- start:53 stop:262 length:210 start_codon:yes stop_codon:yes gene_type:complete
MNSLQKFGKVVQTLKPNVEFAAYDKVETEEDFNKVKWITGEENKIAITTTTCPHSELSWSAVKTEMDKL